MDKNKVISCILALRSGMKSGKDAIVIRLNDYEAECLDEILSSLISVHRFKGKPYE